MAHQADQEEDDEQEEDDFEVGRNKYHHTLRSSVSYALGQMSKAIPEETL